MNPLVMHNVSLSEKMLAAGKPKESYGVASVVGDFIVRMAKEKPLWNFVAEYPRSYNEICSFAVFYEGEELGRVTRDFFRGSYCVRLLNDRISDAKKRGGGYRTSDVSKAVAMAKKTFMRNNIVERVAKAKQLARTTAESVAHNKAYEKRNCDHKVETAMLHYIRGEGLPAFMAYLNADTTEHRNVLNAIDRSATLEEELDVVTAVAHGMSNPPTNDVALVINLGGEYVISRNGEYSSMDNASLPDEFKGKLGLLKLVSPGQFVTEIGGRISEDTFVLTVEPNTVSEGAEE